MQCADLMKPDEDWRGLGDPSERRKIQNRLAQRAYRRNMRERANKIEELKKQLSTYEGLGLHIPQDEDGTYQQGPPQLASPPAHVSFPDDPQFGHVQQQVYPAPMGQHSPIASRPATRQRRESWAPTSSQRTIAQPLTPAPSLPMEGGVRSDGILAQSTPDLSATTYENFPFDRAGPADKGRHLLHLAVEGDHINTIKVLLQNQRVMVDEEDGDGFTPLQRAVMGGKTEIVKLLLEHNADPGPVRGGDGGFGTNFTGL